MLLAPMIHRRQRLAWCALLASTAILSAVSTPAPAQEPVTDEMLREELRARDAVIIDLQQRLRLLQDRLEESGILPAEVEDMEPSPPPPPPTTAEAPAQPAPDRGLIDVDELAAERALERTLVETGALLLPTGQAELTPSVAFVRRDGSFPFIAGGQVFESRVKRNEFTFDLGASIGLPFDSQLELGLPYDVVHQEVSIRGNGGALADDSETATALGDVSIGIAKTVLRENGGWRPDVVVRGIWDTASGERTDDGIALGGGFNELRGQVVAVKRQDPLAFVGAFSYSYTFEDDDIKPGQQFALSLGANLALSPETSLSVTLNQTYSDELEFDGDEIEGSDQLSSTFDFGGSAIIAPRTLLRVTNSIGLTEDAPEYALRASVAYRFNTPFF